MKVRDRLPRRPDYGGGVFRRRIVVRADRARATARLEDDFHRFGVEVGFDGRRIVRVSGTSHRYPWTTCPAASIALKVFEGMEIRTSMSSLARSIRPEQQCTHQLDLACLAIACAAMGIETRRFDTTVPELRDGCTRATLSVDDTPRLAWSLEGLKIVDPAPFEGRRLGSGFAEWAERALGEEAALEALVLRRATFIGLGRQYDFDAMPNPIEFAAATGSRCHSFQPEIIGKAERIVGSGRDFQDRPDALLRRRRVDEELGS